MNLSYRRPLLMLLAAWTIVLAPGQGSAAADPIPADLAQVESAAEAGFDAALAADPAQVAAAAAAAEQGWSRYRARAARDGVPPETVLAVDAALADTRRFIAANAPAHTLARGFNGISAPLARIYAIYKPPVPAALLDLDQLGRALIVDARSADMPLASADLARLAERWASFRPRVLAAKAGRSAASMDSALARARAAIEVRDAAALERAALAETELVDVLEKLFADRARRGAD